MKRACLFISTLLFALNLLAQGNGFDMQVMTGQDIVGTSRYMGMAGAMAAVGGDVSAVKDNPAALGIFRRSEATISAQYQLSQSTPACYDSPNQRVMMTDFGWVFNTGISNFMLGYRRASVFNNEWQTFNRTVPASQTDLMAAQSYGLHENDLMGTDAYNNSDVGWLSKVGYDAWLTEPTTSGGTEWQSLEPGDVSALHSVSESGYLDYYTFAWGINIRERFYLGLSANLATLLYSKSSSYSEGFESGNAYDLESQCRSDGFGFNFQVGMLWRPTDVLRVAAAFQSPTYMQIKTTSWGDINAQILESGVVEKYASSSPKYADDARRRGPLRVTAGVAFQLGTKGMVSTEYDYQHGKETYMVDEHMVKVGGELVLNQHLFLNMGYAALLYGNHAPDEDAFWPSFTSARLDTDFRHYRPKHYASAGLSYRATHWVAGIAYQFGSQKQDLYAHACQYDEAVPVNEGVLNGSDTPGINLGVRTNTHRVALTFAFRY